MRKVSYIVHMPGHKDSQGQDAPWIIKSHTTNEIISSHSTKEQAKEHLKQMHIFKGNSMKRTEKRKYTKKATTKESNISVPKPTSPAPDGFTYAWDQPSNSWILVTKTASIETDSARIPMKEATDITQSMVEEALLSNYDLIKEAIKKDVACIIYLRKDLSVDIFPDNYQYSQEYLAKAELWEGYLFDDDYTIPEDELESITTEAIKHVSQELYKNIPTDVKKVEAKYEDENGTSFTDNTQNKTTKYKVGDIFEMGSELFFEASFWKVIGVDESFYEAENYLTGENVSKFLINRIDKTTGVKKVTPEEINAYHKKKLRFERTQKTEAKYEDEYGIKPPTVQPTEEAGISPTTVDHEDEVANPTDKYADGGYPEDRSIENDNLNPVNPDGMIKGDEFTMASEDDNMVNNSLLEIVEYLEEKENLNTVENFIALTEELKEKFNITDDEAAEAILMVEDSHKEEIDEEPLEETEADLLGPQTEQYELVGNDSSVQPTVVTPNITATAAMKMKWDKGSPWEVVEADGKKKLVKKPNQKFAFGDSVKIVNSMDLSFDGTVYGFDGECIYSVKSTTDNKIHEVHQNDMQELDSNLFN